MTDTNTTAAAAATDSQPVADKRKTTLEGMTGYRTFDSTDEATAYLEKCGSDFTDFGAQPFAMNGINPENGEYDPAIYTDQMRVRVAVLKNVPRTVNGTKEPTTIKAIVVTPVPTLESLLGIDKETLDAARESNPAGIAFVVKTLDKELNHIAVRPLRDTDNLDASVIQMPRSLGDFLESGRDSAGILDTFNETYKAIGDRMADNFPTWNKRKPNKSDLKSAMESTAFATEYYTTLEDRGEKTSLFVLAMQVGIAMAKKRGLPTDIFDKWLATRDAQTLAKVEDSEEGDISLDDLVADLDTPAAEDSTQQPSA